MPASISVCPYPLLVRHDLEDIAHAIGRASEPSIRSDLRCYLAASIERRALRRDGGPIGLRSNRVGLEIGHSGHVGTQTAKVVPCEDCLELDLCRLYLIWNILGRDRIAHQEHGTVHSHCTLK